MQAGVGDFELSVASHSTDMQDDRWMLRANGSRFWAAGSTTALRSESGELLGFGKILGDASDVKEQLEIFRNRSEALLRADEHKNIFLSTLSHELRNPLAPLVNALQLITLSAPDNSALQYPIKLIERQVGFIRRLVDDLLDVTRISTGKIELQLQPTDVREILLRAIESTRPIIAQKPSTRAAYAGRADFRERRQRAPGAGVRKSFAERSQIYAQRREHRCAANMEQTEAIMHVADNGIGIPKEMQPRIFQLFTQVADPTHRSEGLGIGLSLVKNLVELHGGSVQVRSEGPGTGSEFTVRLPLVRPRA